MGDFAAAFDDVLGSEGAFVDNAADPGGATRWGITQRVARAWGYTGPMEELPQATAREIAYAQYWDPYRCNELPQGVALQVFDAAYNGGHPVQWLQLAVGVKVDGHLGPLTVAAAQKAPVGTTVARFNAYRLMYLASLAYAERAAFNGGWMRRIADKLLKGTVNE